VAGSIFSEKVSEGGKENNKIKSITTRSGSTITFDDEKGSILIKDQKGSESTITFDGETNIAVKADTSISLTSGKANITLMSEGDGTITMKAKTFLLDAGETFKLDSGKLIAMDSKDTFNATSTKTSTLNSSMETTVSGQIKTTVTAVGQTIIDGAIVKIN
jgi:hypothetical protein